MLQNISYSAQLHEGKSYPYRDRGHPLFPRQILFIELETKLHNFILFFYIMVS